MSAVCSDSRGGSNGKEQAAAENGCPVVGAVLGLGGAVVGAFLGYLLFVAIAGQGFYAIVLPGALAGVGCGACWTESQIQRYNQGRPCRNIDD